MHNVGIRPQAVTWYMLDIHAYVSQLRLLLLSVKPSFFSCWISISMVVQDFAVEPDEQRMRKAAHLMVGSLAGSLALVTCRDPLRTSLTNRLRSLLAQGLDAAMLEQYVQVRSLAGFQQLVNLLLTKDCQGAPNMYSVLVQM